MRAVFIQKRDTLYQNEEILPLWECSLLFFFTQK